MASYQSKFSGIEIDRAVAYFNAIDKAGRVIVTVGVNINDWKLSANSGNPEDAEHGVYYVDVQMTGVIIPEGMTPQAIDRPPIVYLVQTQPYVHGSTTIGRAGLKWEIEYNTAIETGSIDNAFVRCYSNINLPGKIVIVSVLSTIYAETDNNIQYDPNTNTYYIPGHLVVNRSLS